MGSTRATANSLRAALFVGAVVLAPSVAAAQDKASAEELFQLGKSAMAKNDLTKACAYFQGSLNADFALGTLLNLGICLEQAGKLASAWGSFRTLEDKARQANPPQLERAKYAHERAEALRPRLSRVRLVLSPEAKALEALTVKIDGTVAQPELYDAGVPVDPGKRALLASAPDHEDWSQVVTIEGEKQKLDVTIPALKKRAPAPPPVTAPVASSPSKEETERAASARSQRNLGFIIGGVGAASLVAGGVFGLLALGKSDASKCAADPCVNGSPELDSASSAYSSANTFAWVSNVTLAVGALGLAGGAVLVFTSGPTEARKTATLSVTPTGLVLGGTL